MKCFKVFAFDVYVAFYFDPNCLRFHPVERRSEDLSQTWDETWVKYKLRNDDDDDDDNGMILNNVVQFIHINTLGLFTRQLSSRFNNSTVIWRIVCIMISSRLSPLFLLFALLVHFSWITLMTVASLDFHRISLSFLSTHSLIQRPTLYSFAHLRMKNIRVKFRYEWEHFREQTFGDNLIYGTFTKGLKAHLPLFMLWITLHKQKSSNFWDFCKHWENWKSATDKNSHCVCDSESHSSDSFKLKVVVLLMRWLTVCVFTDICCEVMIFQKLILLIPYQ